MLTGVFLPKCEDSPLKIIHQSQPLVLHSFASFKSIPSLTRCKITKYYPGQSHPTDVSNFSDDTFHVKVAISIFYSHGKTVYFFWLTAACNVFSIAGSHPSFMKSSPVIAWQYLQVFKFSQSFTDGNVMDLLLYATFQEVIFLSSFCAFWISRSSSTAHCTASLTVFSAYVSHPSSLCTTSTSEMCSKCLNTPTRGTFRHIWVSIMRFMPKDVVC